MGIRDTGDESQGLKELLGQARAGDGQAFCQLAAPLEIRLFQQAVALCGDAPTVEDLVSETLVEAWKSLGRYNETCRFSTWLYSILLHRYQKDVRRRRSRPVSLATLPVFEAEEHRLAQADLPARGRSPLEKVMQEEFNEEMRVIIDALDDKHRQVVWLRFFEDATVPEMAVLLACSEGTVKSRLHHALNKLRRMNISVNDFNPGRDT